MFGFIVLVILLVPMYYIPASPPFSGLEGHLEDPFDAFAQLSQNWQIVFATFGMLKLTVYASISQKTVRDTSKVTMSD